eukprot:SAG11_NODE_9_length_28972_cov_81.532539_3_plen_94_part_00
MVEPVLLRPSRGPPKKSKGPLPRALQLSTALYSSLQLSTALPEYSTILRLHLAEYRTGIWYRLVPGTVEVLSRYFSDPVLRFAVAIATAIYLG